MPRRSLPCWNRSALADTACQTLTGNAFVLKLPSCEIEVNKSVLNGTNYKKASFTLKRLRINDEDLCRVRQELLYSRNIDYIRSSSHFMAHEIERQEYTFDGSNDSLDCFIDD